MSTGLTWGEMGEPPREVRSSAQKSCAEAIAVLQLRLWAQRRLLSSNSYFLIPARDRRTLNACRTEVTDNKTPHFNTPVTVSAVPTLVHMAVW